MRNKAARYPAFGKTVSSREAEPRSAVQHISACLTPALDPGKSLKAGVNAGR